MLSDTDIKDIATHSGKLLHWTMQSARDRACAIHMIVLYVTTVELFEPWNLAACRRFSISAMKFKEKY